MLTRLAPSLPLPSLGHPAPPSDQGAFTLLRAPARVLDEVEASLLLDAVSRGLDATLVCGDNRFDAYGLLARARSRGLEDAIAEGLVLARAFTAHQFLALVEETLPLMTQDRAVGVALVTGVIEPFQDEDVTDAEADALLPRTLRSLSASARRAGVPIVATTTRREGRLARLAEEHAPRCVDATAWESPSSQRRLDAFVAEAA